LVIIVIYLYFIHILQGSVEMHLRCGGIYNNHLIANCQPCTTLLARGYVHYWKKRRRRVC